MTLIRAKLVSEASCEGNGEKMRKLYQQNNLI